MRNDVKQSLNKVFEHEKLHLLQHEPMKKTTSKRLMPIFMSVAFLLIVTVVTVSLLQDSPNNPFKTEVTQHTASDKATFDHLKGAFIGDNGAMSEITNGILSPYQRDGIALQTSQQPYGITVNAMENIPQHMQYKYAVYVFSLIQNAGYIEIANANGSSIIDRETLEMTSGIDFTLLEGDEQIMSAYYAIAASQIPQLQTNREDAYKYLWNALQETSFVSDFGTISAPNFTFTIDEESYLLWVDPETIMNGIYIVNIEKPNEAIMVSDDVYKDLKQYVHADTKLIMGEVKEIADNQLLIETGDAPNIMSYLVTIDNGSNYKTGDIVTVWSTMATASIPAQANATKIQKH